MIQMSKMEIHISKLIYHMNLSFKIGISTKYFLTSTTFYTSVKHNKKIHRQNTCLS